MSIMRETMNGQPEALRRIIGDPDPVAAAAERLSGRRVLLVGTGTSWHAANQGATLLRLAGVHAWPVQAADAAAGDPAPGEGDALVLLSHKGTKRWTTDVLGRARADGVPSVVISRQGNDEADLDTVPVERAAAYTASHLGALLRLAQLAVALGASLSLDAVPDAVAAELAAGPAGVAPPARLLEFAGAGINGWTAAEGSLKIREAARVASEGMTAEQVLHGPAVALGSDDALVLLDGGGPGSERLEDLARAVESHGTPIHRFSRPDLGEPLSIFPLIVIVQKIAAEAAETLGTDPDAFGREVPGREEGWSTIRL
jgi:glucosamine--fructose-6-phosphate aminotransferase (isomerizing)